MKSSSILGLNARGVLFTGKYNSRAAKKIADSKLQTDRVLRHANVPHPIIFKKFTKAFDVFDFKWSDLPDAFALKPSRGLGGEGIIVVKKRISDNVWLTSSKKKITIEDLKLHTLDILEGAFSMGNEPDSAFIQEYVGRHPAFRKYAFRGTPDIRVIVFNKIPVMAMLRLPTKESGGRANLHQGALGLGIDIASGITTKAILNNKEIALKPGTSRKLRGIKIPYWNKILEISVTGQIASGLVYAGVDIVLHPEKGPQIIELNAQPGLSIQLANMEGLKRRLERVDDIQVMTAEHGVKIAKALFAGKFVNRVKNNDDIKTIKAIEEVGIVDANAKQNQILAKIDTGAWSSTIDISLARKLGLLKKNKIIATRKKLSSLGEEERPLIAITFYLSGRKIITRATVSDRKLLRYQFLIGRIDLQGFLISPTIDKDNLVKAKW
ncbi:MAG: sugar-transfer associated ATP-grasp domain-containing protein [Candidatus Woesebacteria bacterium]|nr:sugar-transfer associated ATP-grasp domain-containing protein [Candidatus Woesebacteria bacterium]